MSARASGFEYVDVQLGGDVSVSPNVAVGPFVSFATGQYRTGRYVSVLRQGTYRVHLSHDITDHSFHEWLLFGVRGVYNVRP